jgi:hypothetical protein
MKIEPMKLILRFTSFILIAISFLTGCKKDEVSNIKADKELILELHNKAVDIITIDSHEYFIDAYLWRDFAPISPQNGNTLISINWLIRADSTAIPENIELKQQYVVYDDSLWIADYVNETRNTPEYIQEKISRNGPKWGPFVYVDVIAKITDIKTNRDFYLKRDKVFIIRTD